MTLTLFLHSAQINGDLLFDWTTGQYTSQLHPDVEMIIQVLSESVNLNLFTASIRYIGDAKVLICEDKTVHTTIELINAIRYYVNRGWHTETLYQAVPTENGETVQEDETVDLDELFNQLGEEFDNASTLVQYQVVANKWQGLKGTIDESGMWSDFEEDMNSLSADINAAIKGLQPAPAVTVAPVVVNKPKPSVSLKGKTKELQVPVEGESIKTYVCRVLKNDFSYNPTLNAKVFRVPNTDTTKIQSQLKPYLDKFFPENASTYTARQVNKDVELSFPERIPSIITETTSIEDAVKRVRFYYNLVDLGLCEDNQEEFKCATTIADILINEAAENGDVDLTQPIETYIEFDEEGE